MSETTLLIARHGNNFDPGDTITRIGARTDLPLSKSGLRQGLAMGRHLLKDNLVPVKIFTSDLLRTKQMAAQVQKALKLKIPTEALPEFNEIDYGPDENQTEEKVIARIGENGLKAWDEMGMPPPGWIVDPVGLRAAWYDFGQRIATEHAGQCVMLITHNGVARFASILTGDRRGLCAELSTSEGAKLATGAFGHLTNQAVGGPWDCVGWNIKPVLRSLSDKKLA